MADFADIGSDYTEKWLEAQLSEHAYQMGHAVRDIEAEVCNGCSYATKAAWGKTCEAWSECRADVDRRDSAENRNKGAGHAKR